MSDLLFFSSVFCSSAFPELFHVVMPQMMILRLGNTSPELQTHVFSCWCVTSAWVSKSNAQTEFLVLSQHMLPPFTVFLLSETALLSLQLLNPKTLSHLSVFHSQSISYSGNSTFRIWPESDYFWNSLQLLSYCTHHNLCPELLHQPPNRCFHSCSCLSKSILSTAICVIFLKQNHILLLFYSNGFSFH